jgi:hypothetical protein
MRSIARARTAVLAVVVALAPLALADDRDAARRAEESAARAEAAATRSEAAAARVEGAIGRLEKLLDEMARREEARSGRRAPDGR